ncbi:MAG: methylmalonyl-CoA mutase [Gammaproteobacteria bacterium]
MSEPATSSSDAPRERRTTPSGIEVPVVATHASRRQPDLSGPGEYPYTRGIFEDGFRGRLWTFRQYSGFGSAEASNERYRFLLERGQTGLSVALDLPTQCGYDPTDPMARSEVGKVGVPIATLADMETLFRGIDLAKVSTSFTINGSAAMIFAMYLAAADKAGVPRAKLTGTIQNDILKEYVARGTWIFPVRPALRLVADSIVYANQESPRFNPISIAGAHVRDAGSSAVEEMGFTLANGLAYVDELLARGADLERFAQSLSFFFYVHMNFFEEVAKFRGARRLWARLMKERYGAKSARAQHFRFGVVCGGSSLTAAQPYNNVVRVAVETMAAALGGAQSIFTCAYDEAFQLPTEQSAELALRTQQVIAYESGIADTVDPLGGSHYVEYLTDEMESAIEGVIQEIADYGGVVKAIEDGYLQRRIARSAHERKSKVDRGESVVVGVNRFRNEQEEKQVGEVFASDAHATAAVIEKFERIRAERDAAQAEKTLAALELAASDNAANLMPYLVDCCHAYVSVGEMVERLKRQWGEFIEPVKL